MNGTVSLGNSKICRNIPSSRVVVRTTKDHHNGFYDEVIQWMIPMFATLYEAFKFHAEMWANNLTEHDIMAQHIDDGSLGALLLAPTRETHFFDRVRQSGVSIFGVPESDIFGVPSKGPHSDKGMPF